MRRCACSSPSPCFLCVSAYTGADEPTDRTLEVAQEAKRIKGLNALVRSVQFSPDGSVLGVGESDRTLWLFETETRTKRAAVTLPPGKG